MKGKYLLILSFCLLFFVGLCGCTSLLQDPSADIPPQSLSAPSIKLPSSSGERVLYVAFGKQPLLTDLDYRSIAEFEDYQSPSSHFGYPIYFEGLSPEERRVYSAILYAYDQDLQTILLDDRIFSECALTFTEIFQAVSLDTPLIAQNISLQSTNLSLSLPGGGTTTATAYTVKEFSSEQKEKKEQAIKKAEDILSLTSHMENDLEKAAFFYRYLGEHTVYTTEKEGEPCYLYDALLKGETLCDGFAGAFSLLCNMADIPCFEKAYFPKESDKVGHTWNCLQIDGRFTNVDATVSDEVKKNNPRLKCFGYGDELQEYTPAFLELLPAAHPLEPFDLVFSSIDDPQAPALLEERFKANGGRVLVLFEKGDREMADHYFDLYARQLSAHCTEGLAYHSYRMAGKYVCYFYDSPKIENQTR